MTARMGGDTLTHLAMHRVLGKPFTVSEYNHPAPNDYRAECFPMVAAFAALQDWDGVFEFDYGATPTQWEGAQISGYFTMVTDPAKLAFAPIAANLLRRGDVSPAEEELRLRVPVARVPELLVEHGNSVSSAWVKSGVPRAAAVRHRLAIELVDEGELQADAIELAQPTDVTSDTGKIRWLSPQEGKDLFTVDTEKTKVALGRIAGGRVDVGRMSFEVGATGTGWAAVALTSMDDLSLTQSRRMLLVVVSKVENQGMGWNEQRTTVGTKWGQGPTVTEGVSVKVGFGQDRELEAYALDGRGLRVGHPVLAAAGEVVLDASHKTVWYELAAP